MESVAVLYIFIVVYLFVIMERVTFPNAVILEIIVFCLTDL